MNRETKFVEAYTRMRGCTTKVARKVYKTADDSYINEIAFNLKGGSVAAYTSAFIRNFAAIYFYKSRRKTAKVSKVYYVQHLPLKRDDDDWGTSKVSDGHIIDLFIETLKTVYAYSKPNNINFSVCCHEYRDVKTYNTERAKDWCWLSERKHFDDFRVAAYWLYHNVFCRIYPYCKVDFAEIEQFDPRYIALVDL